MIADASTTLNMIRFELLLAQRQLQQAHPQGHRSCLDALWKVYCLAQPHTRREDNKMPFSDLPQPIANPRHWQDGAAKARSIVQEALNLHQHMQQGKMGWASWNALADHMLDALNLL
ncbi:hypothetical protein [Deinococcus cellulosilyticus]|uniref:Uncharacterized protein n=1 Tax=Deinococcus cellulosilyticus (strain DSM 18568 / NBRC 106333 / KACC 11606 / 5516J-15) TaxID=1223518 RepID=A0A511N385_DEIC1|nr:hypothetical protein [Deinococcus cellulosilyticus]GEM46861.1 hypothetical protein DC3_24960 [Deinococcus cellulosilyticus NBRC 106333 = KACC 11606]